MSYDTINITTTPFSTTNKVRLNLYKEEDDQVIIDSKEAQGPTGQLTWVFSNLEKGVTYLVKAFEVSGSIILQQYPIGFNFTTAAGSIVRTRNNFSFIGDVTPGVDSEIGVAVFDGSNGTEDLRGWDVSQLTFGHSFFERDYQYTWDSTTGTITLLEDNIFGTDPVWTMQFESIVENASAETSSAGTPWKGIKLITGTYDIAAVDIGYKLLVKGATSFFRLKLPPITTVVPGKVLFIESGLGLHKGFALDVDDADTGKIDWLKGDRSTIYFNPMESLQIYRERFDSNTNFWRVSAADGSWVRLGHNFYSDASLDMLINCLRLDGGGVTGRGVGLLVDDYPKLYNDFVALLSPASLAPYSTWSTGNNKYKYSLAGGSPLRFHIPDRRGLFNRFTDDIRNTGDFEDDMFKEHNHASGTLPGKGNGFKSGSGIPRPMDYEFGSAQGRGFTADEWTQKVGGTETRPKNIAINEFIYH